MSTKRYEASRVREGDKYETWRGPYLDKQPDDLYIFSREGDRLDLLSQEFYGDPRYWWVIAEANHLGKGSFAVRPGLQLRIPRSTELMFEKLEKAVEDR
tara:strand:- start:114 stop:410 length:297 start_codon:yes stop_codon:yes gene_type:complete